MIVLVWIGNLFLLGLFIWMIVRVNTKYRDELGSVIVGFFIGLLLPFVSYFVCFLLSQYVSTKTIKGLFLSVVFVLLLCTVFLIVLYYCKAK